MIRMRGFASPWTLVLGTGAAIALLCGIGWYVSQSHAPATEQSAATSTAPLVATQTVGSTTTYTNHQFNFSISYPSSLAATTSTAVWSGAMANLQHGKLVVVLPDVSQDGATRGAFVVLASAAADDVRNCTTTSAQIESGNPPLHIVSINGATFAHYEVGQPAAGQFGVDSVYKIQQGNTCIALDESYEGIETSHLSGAAATQNDADIAAVSGELDSIMRSWRFLPPVNAAPSCSLSAGASSYAVGDSISLSWVSHNATSAWWEKPVDSSHPGTLVPPADTPSVSGGATALANIAGTHALALDVEGPGGLASCSVPLTIVPSNARPSVTVTELSETPNAPGTPPSVPTRITMYGTVQNAALLNSDSLDIVFADASYSGPTDWNSLFWRVNVMNYDSHPQHDGEYVEVPVTSTSTAWSARLYNRMPPGSYRYYIFAAPANGLATSSPLLASGTFRSVSWSTDPNIAVVYPRSGSVVSSALGFAPQDQYVYWTVPQGVVASFPSGYNLSMMLYLENQNNPGVSIPINDGNAFLPGVTSWNLYRALQNGTLTPGTYRIAWHLEANPTDFSQVCAQVVNGECVPSAAAQAAMLQAQNINGETGWFTVDK